MIENFFDQGLLAVFTGRGCGTTRDVNFFRPTYGPCLLCVRLTELVLSDVEGTRKWTSTMSVIP